MARVETLGASHVRAKKRSFGKEPSSEYVSGALRHGAASYFANAAATNPSDEVHEESLRRGGVGGQERRCSAEEEKKTKSTVFSYGRMHRREVHASQPYGLLHGPEWLSSANLVITAN
ncbi:hypothetical protein X777_10670 [Ooceraea biroi]|uniref:Uncharacterized protein n=1 Tax=Ooceraea biroi TaxID=2015173 RepID=A0A026W328_OOCBI|nr:hypothetical protein X777_10670 [Ooceraea biroi]